MQLDEDFDSIRALLGGARPDAFKPQVTNTDTDKDYDQLVRDLVFDKRSKPSDRTKTEDEIAAEEKAKLEKMERARLRRMRGDPEESDEDEEGGRYQKRRKRERGGDDLEDDFELDEDEGIPGLGSGLAEQAPKSDDDEDASAGDEDESESADELEDGEDESEDESGDDVVESTGEEETIAGPSTTKREKAKSASKDLPYTFTCPSSHEELLDILENVDDDNVPTVIQRIRTLYHPSLATDNTAKLQVSDLPHQSLTC